MDLKETKLTSTPRYHGIIVDVRTDTVRLPDGREASREVVTHPGGVAILPLTDDGKAILVRQFRYCVDEALLEVPAGKLEPGEDPFPAAVRELEEEVGVTAERMEYLGGLYVSPGFCTEMIHLFLATGLKQGMQHPDEDEFLNVETYRFEELLDMVMRGEITDAKTAALVMKAQLLKEREGLK